MTLENTTVDNEKSRNCGATPKQAAVGQGKRISESIFETVSLKIDELMNEEQTSRKRHTVRPKTKTSPQHENNPVRVIVKSNTPVNIPSLLEGGTPVIIKHVGTEKNPKSNRKRNASSPPRKDVGQTYPSEVSLKTQASCRESNVLITPKKRAKLTNQSHEFDHVKRTKQDTAEPKEHAHTNTMPRKNQASADQKTKLPNQMLSSIQQEKTMSTDTISLSLDHNMARQQYEASLCEQAYLSYINKADLESNNKETKNEKYSSTKCQEKAGWDKMHKRLQKYVKDHGHANISHKDGDGLLRRW
eukprot:scaffold66280_cov52-Attheya_sp.AAC.1